SLIAVFLACFRDYSKLLAPGERAVVLVLASDRRQARIVFDYVRGFLRGVPMLERMIESETKKEIHLTNRVSLEIKSATFRGTRGYTLAGVVLDEVAFWQSDELGANPDREIVRALRPGMATLPARSSWRSAARMRAAANSGTSIAAGTGRRTQTCSYGRRRALR